MSNINETPYTVEVVVGNDNGNSEHDIIINGHQICSPNVMAKVRKMPLLDEINPDFVAKNIQDNLIVTIDSPLVSPAIYYAGNYALKSGERVKSIEVGTDNNKVDSDIVMVNTLAQIAGYSVKEVYDKDKDIKNGILVNVKMATALPIKQYNKSEAERFANKFMDEKHKVTVQLGTKRIDVTVNFEFVKVIPEGVTAVHAIQNISKENQDIFDSFNTKYEIKASSSYFKNKKILHVGIGEGTTELPVTDDIIFNPNFIRGINNGIGHAIDRSLDEFKDEVGLKDYTRQKYSEIIKDESHKFYPVAQDIIEGYIDDEAEEILHAAKQEIQRSGNEVDIIMVYGGGSIPMKSKLEKKLLEICEKGEMKLFYVPEKYAVIFESMGLYQFATGKIFSTLAKRKLGK